MGSPPIPDHTPTKPSNKGKERASHVAPSPTKLAPIPSPRKPSVYSNSTAFASAAPTTVTYRHIISQAQITPQHPLRTIAHIDIDAAYAAMEMVRLGVDEDKPLAVQQWQGLIAVNYPARKFGITRMESATEALKKCPELILAHVATYREGDEEPGYWDDALPATHKVSLDYYRRESVKILKVFKEVEGAIVEKASIDESYLDLTTPVIAAILSRYPSLSKPPSTSTSNSTSQGLDTPLPSPASMGIRIPWSEVGNIIPVRGASGAEGDDEGQAEEEVEEEVTWHDVALWIGAEMVAKCRAGVQTRLGYTCSAGIAGNKMLAKLCSAWKKPNAQTVLRTAAVAGFLNPFPFQKIRNLGGKLGNQVAETWKAESVGELLGIELKEFQRELGEENGKWVWEVIRGGEWGEVEEKTLVKSMLSSKNFRPSISKLSEVYHWIHVLSTELYGRLADARAEAEIWPKTLTFHYRTLNYTVRSHQLPFPYTSNLTIAYIDNLAQRLVKAALPPKVVPTETVGPWNNFSLGFGGLERGEKGQAGIQSFFSAGLVEKEAGGKVEGKRKAEEVVILSSEDGGGTGDAGDAGDAEKEEELRERKRRKKEERLAAAAASKAKAAAAPSTFPCERCAKPVSIPAGQDLDKAKAEHADYHVARDLLEGERMAMRGPPKPLAAASTVGRESGTGAGSGKKGAKKGVEEGKRAKGQSSLTGFFGRK